MFRIAKCVFKGLGKCLEPQVGAREINYDNKTSGKRWKCWNDQIMCNYEEHFLSSW